MTVNRLAEVRYDGERLAIEAQHGTLAGVLAPNGPAHVPAASEVIARCLAEPVGSARLRELARGRSSAAILVPGVDRVAGARTYVPAIIEELNRGGIPLDRISVCLAPGTHVHRVEDDAAVILGPELAARVAMYGHACRDQEAQEHLGTTSFGTPVHISRRVLDADLRILTGRVIPHYFAGYSGGRKALVPGVAGMPTILANHKLTLGNGHGIHPQVRPGVLDGNPVHHDMVDAALMARPDFCLNTVLDEAGRMVDAVAGDMLASHAAACEVAGKVFNRCLSEQVDALITSAGGAPYDCNFMQALKAVFNVQELVRPDGAILWIAACPQGMHQGFLDWAAHASDDDLNGAVRDHYNLTGHNSIMLRRLTRKARVALWSQLPAASVERLGLHPVTSLDEGLRWLSQQLGHSYRYAVIPFANVIAGSVDAH